MPRFHIKLDTIGLVSVRDGRNGWLMNSFSAILAILLACLLETGCSRLHENESQVAQTKTSPSLAETEKWITQTFKNDATAQHFVSGLEDSAFKVYRLDFDKCKATLDIEQQGFSSRAGFNGDHETYSFNLADIDPLSIKFVVIEMPEHYADVTLRTTDDTDSVELNVVSYGEQANRPEKPRSVHKIGSEGVPSLGGIPVAEDYAPRFVNALRHAVELCGGKPSAF